MEPEPTFARAALTSDSHSVHSGHSLTDTYANGAIDSWPGDFANLFISQFGEAAYVYETTYRRDVIPGSTMQIRWDENPTGHARHQIGTYDTLMITEAAPLFGRPTPQSPTVSNTTLDYLLRFAENTYLNARNAPGEVILWSIWPNVEGWIGYGGPEEGAWSDLGGFRGCLLEYGRSFRFFAEYVTWKMHELHLDMPADWKIWVFPGHAWWARVYDDIQAGLVPGITDHRQLFRDDIHPNTVGEYAMAVFVYTMLYQVDCRTIDYAPPAAAVSADLDTYFKRVAWEVATAEASVGMGGTDNAAPSFDPAIHGDPLAIASGEVDPLEPVEVANLLWASSEPVVMDGATVINNDLSAPGAAGAPLYAVISFIPDALQPKSAGGVFQVRSSTGEAMMTLTYRQDLDVVVFDNGLSGSFHATHSVPDADVEAGVPITIEPTATPSARIVGPYNNNTSALTASANPAISMRFGTPDWGGEIMAGIVHALAIFDRVPTVAQRAGLVTWAEAQYMAPEPEPAIDSVVVIGASLMNAMFGKDTSIPHAEASALLAAAGHDIPVYGYATGGARLDQGDDHYSAARAAHPNALIVSHFGGNNVTDSRPYPGGQSTFNTGLANLLMVAQATSGSTPCPCRSATTTTRRSRTQTQVQSSTTRTCSCPGLRPTSRRP